ncbi:hypothetical protein KUCAC02_019028 [Chaenocephalus aceratus]|uniref:Uncharacterized protein n=1 Tax=Chaenocephalus aceratus TaxID=36190 RepID=A0ACB9WB72_CHAAC|nr:hypothetical protein KUCAC02_019028 [Chaenocephalus aceratus]
MCRGLESLPTTCLERAKELKALFGSLLQKSDHSILSKKNDKLRLILDEPLKMEGVVRETVVQSKWTVPVQSVPGLRVQ